MIRNFLFLTFAVFILTFSPNARAQEPIEIIGAYAYETTPAQKHGAVFLELDNKLPESDFVMGAESTVSQEAQLHTHLMEEGIMMMREVEGYPLPALTRIKLEPMGDHVMLMDLYEPLAAGQEFPLTLILEKAGRLETIVTVRSLKDKPVNAHEMHGMAPADTETEFEGEADPAADEDGAVQDEMSEENSEDTHPIEDMREEPEEMDPHAQDSHSERP